MKGLIKILLFISLAMHYCTYAKTSDIIVVVNSNNQTTKMSKSKIIDLFMGKDMTYPNGAQARTLDIVDSQKLKTNFYYSLVGMSLSRVNSYWSRIQFSGRGRPSAKKQTEKEIIAYISRTENAIGYIHRKNLNDKLKVVFEFDE